MLIIAGHVLVDPARRDTLVAELADLVRRARQAPGCLDVAVTADSVDPGRINNLERWASAQDLHRWREVAHAPDLGDEVLSADVSLFDATGQRSPF